jgi:hypothetical protein
MERSYPPTLADEATSLIAYLDWQRSIILAKTDGLTDAQLNVALAPSTLALAPSTLTLAGLLKHLWLVEDSWVKGRFLGIPEEEPWLSAPFDDDPDWEFHSAVDDDGDWLRESYERACATNNALIAGLELDQRAEIPLKSGDDWTLRWMLLHLIEETARHAGHADFLREAVDGVVGE